MARLPSLNAPYFHDDEKAREFLESVRWPNGPVCPHCGAEGGYPIKTKDIVRKNGRIQKARKGLYKCTQKECREQFSVTVGTIMERSHFPLSKWLLAVHMLCAGKKGTSSHQLKRMFGLTSYQTAWFLSHRIRHAMADNGPLGLMGLGGVPVEADETYIGNKYTGARKRERWQRAGHGHKHTVFSLVERGGQVRSTHITGDTFEGVKAALSAHGRHGLERERRLRLLRVQAHAQARRNRESRQYLCRPDRRYEKPSRGSP